MVNKPRSVTGPSASRRAVLGGAAAGIAAVAFGSRLAGAQEASPEAGTDGVQPDNSWAFTDDRGIHVVVEAVPVKIAAQTTAAAALFDFGVPIAGIYGPSKLEDGTTDFQAGNVDIDSVVVLGDYGTDSLEIDMEKFVELEPDLVVDLVVYDQDFWYLAGDSYDKVTELGVPTAGISMGQTSILTVIQRFEALAGSLGADLTAHLVTDAVTAHAAAETALKDAIAAKPGLSVVVISPTLQNVYVASPRYMVDLKYFQDLGLTVVDHDTDDYFALIGWEEIGNYAADIILIDARSYGQATMDEMADAQPIWNTLPTVQAGQVGSWYATAPYSYSRLIPIMEELTALIITADPDVAP